MNVLSLFDGMSCGQIALNRLGIHYENYYASEIDSDAIKVTQKNYPNTIQLGDVTKLNPKELPYIDLLIAGSPCQSFSSAGDGTGFEGESGLFWEFIRVLREVKPRHFMLENVMMKKEWIDIITNEVGVSPIVINSSLVSAAHRKRVYWTNISSVEIPRDRGVFIEDIVEDLDSIHYTHILKAKNVRLLTQKVNLDNCPKVAAIDVYNKKFKTDRKVPTLTMPNHNSLRLYQDGYVRKFTALELERCQTVPEGYTDAGLTLNQRHALLGNGWTIDVVCEIFKNIKS